MITAAPSGNDAGQSGSGHGGDTVKPGAEETPVSKTGAGKPKTKEVSEKSSTAKTGANKSTNLEKKTESRCWKCKGSVSLPCSHTFGSICLRLNPVPYYQCVVIEYSMRSDCLISWCPPGSDCSDGSTDPSGF